MKTIENMQFLNWDILLLWKTAYFELDGSKLSKKKLWRWQEKARKVSGSKKKKLEEHFATSYVNWQQFSNMTGIKRPPLRGRDSVSEK